MRTLVSAITLAMLLPLASATVQDPPGQVFPLDGFGVLDTLLAVGERGEPTSIAPGGTAYWTAVDAAASFEMNSAWLAALQVYQGRAISLTVGVYTGSEPLPTGFTPCATGTVNLGAVFLVRLETPETVNVPMPNSSPCAFAPNDNLVLAIENTGAGAPSAPVVIGFNPDSPNPLPGNERPGSVLQYDVAGPPYPTPELTTILLVGTGLVGTVAVLAVRRRGAK